VELDLPVDFNGVFDGRGRVRAWLLAGSLVRRPGAVVGLMLLARESRRAATLLGEFLERFVAAVAERRGREVRS
jgi:hypothetical protein